MRNQLTVLVSLALLVCTGASANGLLPAPEAADLVPSQLIAAPDPGFASESQAVSFAWALDRNAALEAPQPYVAESREFFETVDAARLQAGYRIDTTAPGAVIRISPEQSGRVTAISAAGIEIEHNGTVLNASQALDQVATSEELRQAGLDFGNGALAFRVKPELGAGDVVLRAGKARGRYLVHVFEPNSPMRLVLGSERSNHIAGQTLAVSARLYDGDAPMAAQRLGGLVTAPDGRTFPLEFKAGTASDGSTQIVLPSEASTQPGLWEVHTFATGRHAGGRLLRDAKIAVAVAAPTARLSGDYGVDSSQGLKVSLGVEAASAGRYEVGAVLYGTDVSGGLAPMAAARTADVLTAGQGELVLEFPAELMGRGFSAPYALRDITLSDQSRMGRLEARAIGPEIAIPAAQGTGPQPLPGGITDIAQQ
ncbi:MAG: DUF4785 family protein [Xanthomonadaceae bacterium]|nr:DUF4785 family protein [Xanthomonadaceae bacterium]